MRPISVESSLNNGNFDLKEARGDPSLFLLAINFVMCHLERSANPSKFQLLFMDAWNESLIF